MCSLIFIGNRYTSMGGNFIKTVFHSCYCRPTLKGKSLLIRLGIVCFPVHPTPWEKRSPKMEEFSPLGANYSILEYIYIEKGGKAFLTQLPPLQMYPVHNCCWKGSYQIRFFFLEYLIHLSIWVILKKFCRILPHRQMF